MGVFDRKSEARLSTGISQLSRGKLVATDRLHGHILATLLADDTLALERFLATLKSLQDRGWA